jgi:amino acid adenylation domain-containing protein
VPTESISGFRTSLQQGRLWTEQQGQPPLLARAVFLLEGGIDAAALHAALLQVAGRHESLRTTFHRPAGMRLPLQRIGEGPAVNWQALDLRGGNEQAHIDELLRTHAVRRVDLEHGPLLQATLATLSANRAVLVISAAALCADLPSLLVLGEELRRCCSSAAPAEPPLQYADFAEWESQLLGADDEDSLAATRFWGRPDTALPRPVLPWQRPVASASTFAPESTCLSLPNDLIAAIDATARQAEVSPATVLLTGWECLLAQLTGDSDFVLGVELDGRTQEELRGAIGLFARAVPVPAHIENMPFTELVARAQTSLAEAEPWQQRFDASKAAPLDVRFSFLAVPPATGDGNITWSLLRADAALGRYALQLSCLWREGRGELVFSYDPRQLTREEVDRISGYFERLLAGACKAPGAPISEVDIVGEKERHTLLVERNQTAVAYPQRKCLHDWFEEQAARTPDRAALRCGDTHLTYRQLNARANQIAHELRRRGVGRNVVVGLCLTRSADMIIGLLGALKAGGAFVPLDPELPKARLSHLIRQTATPIILTQTRFLDRLPEFVGPALCLDQEETFAARPDTNPEGINDPEDLVYVIYTSGSTGAPKGVAVRHRNLINYVHFILGLLGQVKVDGEGRHFATVSTLAADLGNTCIFPALVSGGCLHVIPYETAMDGNAFGRYLAKHPIDVLKITPSHLAAILAVGGEAVLPRRYLVLGGEAPSWELVDRVKKARRCAIINHYGPTETTIGALTLPLDNHTDHRGVARTIPIGRPIANTQIYVLGPGGKLVPDGVAGELYIGGAGVAAGYLQQPEQTSERFVSDTFSGAAGAFLYRTGDKVRYLPDGCIEFLGRLDHQVKVRGFRVEPAEIEAALRRHPGIAEAVAVARDDAAGEKRLHGYFVPRPGATAKVEDVRAFLGRELPEYMVPAALVPLEALPLTPNGKVDLRALPVPDPGRQVRAAYIAPRTPVEETLASIWAEVLRQGPIGVHDDFFELGGHSLLATQVVSRICSAFQVELPLGAVFQSPTVAGLAEVVQECQASSVEEEDLSRMLAELEGLSEEEVQRLLAVQMQQEGS